MPNDDEDVLAQALGALDGGDYTEDEVNAIVAADSDYPNLFALRMAVESSFDAEAAAAMKDIGEHPVQSFLGSAAQGATFGFADELVGAAGFPEAGRRLQQAQEDRAQYAPGADALGQIAGSLLLPAIPAAGAAKAGGTIGRSALTGAARGGLFGALGGAAAGAGFAEEGQRLEGARSGALWGGGAGATLGTGFGAIGGLLGSGAGRGARVAQNILDLSGQEDASLLNALGRVAAQKEEIQQTLYRPLERAHGPVQDPAIQAFLHDVGSNRFLRGTMTSAGVDPQVRPTLNQLQDLRAALRKRAFNKVGDIQDREALARVDELSLLMQDVFGDDLRVADAAWAEASANGRAVRKGWAFYNKPAELIQQVRGSLPEAQLDAFDQGRLARITAQLTERRKGASSLLSQYMDMGDDTRRRVGLLFPGGVEGSTFEQFERMMRSSAREAAIVKFFNSAVKSAAIGAAGGAAASSLLGGGSGGGGGR